MYVSVNKLSVSVDAPSSAGRLPLLCETLQIVLWKGQRNTQFNIAESRFKVLRFVAVGGIFTFIDYRVLTCKCCVVHVLWLADGKQTETRCNGRARSYEKETSAARNTSGPFAVVVFVCRVLIFATYLQSVVFCCYV